MRVSRLSNLTALRGVAASLRGAAPLRRWSSTASEFHELRERSLLKHTIKASSEGDPLSVMVAMDEFWDTYYRGQYSEEWKLRGAAIDAAILAKPPATTLELGTYCGYSAVRIGRLLPPGAQLISVEIDPLYAAIATKVVEHAGLSESVKIEIGSLSERLDAIQNKYALGKLDALLMDHGTSEYLGDLQILEGKGLIKEDTSILCDWSLYPGSDEDPQTPSKHEEFVKHMEASGRAAMSRQTLHNKEVFSVSNWSGFPV